MKAEIHIRLTEELKKLFLKKAKDKLQTPAALLRDFIEKYCKEQK